MKKSVDQNTGPGTGRKVSERIRAVANSLCHRETSPLPRGELFIGQDFLDYHFAQLKGDCVKQMEAAAHGLGLSLVGVDLNSERARSALSSHAYTSLGDYFLVACVNGPFSLMVEKYGFFDAMSSTKRKPSLFSEIAVEQLEEIRRVAASARENGFSGIVLADDIAGKNGLLFSVHYFCETVWPVYRDIAETIKEADLFAFLHSDGNMRSVMGLLIDAGYDCLHPIDAQGGLDLYELRTEFGGRVSFMGHVDVMAWDRDRILKETRLAESEFGSGGLILGSAGGLSMDVAEEALWALYPQIKGAESYR